jgi:ABC-type Na+ efflux pump permease subunit
VTMLLRLASATLPWWEIAAALVVLLLSVVFCIYLGARIFSRGILQFDRLLSFKEIGRMLKKDY